MLYADDASAGQRRLSALALLEEHAVAGTAVLSTQVLQEYFVIATKKLAVDLQRAHSISFWDALIVRAAGAAGCAIVFSEDMQDGRSFDGVRIVNPLRTPH